MRSKIESVGVGQLFPKPPPGEQIKTLNCQVPCRASNHEFLVRFAFVRVIPWFGLSLALQASGGSGPVGARWCGEAHSTSRRIFVLKECTRHA